MATPLALVLIYVEAGGGKVGMLFLRRIGPAFAIVSDPPQTKANSALCKD
jgi:hypothetical protein